MGVQNFCDSPLWDANLTWWSDRPDFTPCFHATVLPLVPGMFLLVTLPLQLWLCKGSQACCIPTGRLARAKEGLALLLCLCQAWAFALELRHQWASPSPVVSKLVSPVLLSSAIISSMLLAKYVRWKGIPSSGVLFIFWFFLVTSSLPRVISTSYPDPSPVVWRRDEQALAVIYTAVSALGLLLHFWAEPPPRYRDLDAAGPEDAEKVASFPSRLFFSFVTPLLKKGWKKPLEFNDLNGTSRENMAQKISKDWERTWSKKFSNKQNGNVIWAIIDNFGPIWVLGPVLEILGMTFQLISPRLQGLLIAHVSNPDEESWKGYLYVAGIFLSNVMMNILFGQYVYNTVLVGVRIRIALVVAIFKKSLGLSATARKERTIGQTVTIMSIDAPIFHNLVFCINTLWNTAILVGVSLYFLWGYLGPACLAMPLVMAAILPILVVTGRTIKKLQARLMKLKDERIRVVGEMLEGIKVIKFNAWEGAFSRKIRDIRAKEIRTLKTMTLMNCVQNFFMQSAPFLIAVASFSLYTFLESNTLDAQRAFVSLSYFNIMKDPLEWLPNFINQMIQGSVSIGRINRYLNSSEICPSDIGSSVDPDLAVQMDTAGFSWDAAAEASLVLDGIQMKRGSLTGIIGQVGSGKSSLLSSLILDMEKKHGNVYLEGSIAYVPQQAFIRNATLRDNITFGKPFDRERYDLVLQACALLPDLEILDNGDETEIGEKGINLSGGQKQRVSLARAVYSDRDIILLDDPLSAVDASVARHIFSMVLDSSTGLLKNKTRLLVTHSMSYLPMMDQIIVMREGKVVCCSTYAGLRDMDHDEEWNFIEKYCLVDEKSEKDDTQSVQEDAKAAKKNPSPNANGLVVAERVETASVKGTVYLYYLKALGVVVATLAICFHSSSQILSVSSNMWLARWSSDNKSSIPSVEQMYLSVYGTLGTLSGLSLTAGTLSLIIGAQTASFVLHNKMLDKILHVPIRFFDTNPKGRIVNRFSSDLNDVDTAIPQCYNQATAQVLQVAGIIFVICFTNYTFLAIFVPMLVLYWLLIKAYVATSRQIRRIMSIKRSPLYSHFNEALTGISTIRAYDRNADFNQECKTLTDQLLGTFLNFVMTNRWMSMRLQLMGCFVVLFAALFSVVERNSLSPGIVGLSLTYALEISGVLNALVRLLANIETSMVSVERIQEYQEQLEPEAAYHVPEEDPPPDWPQQGQISFSGYSTRYREGLRNALDNVSLDIKAGEKVGIVGRTGAGKSSLTLALFRLIEPVEGSIAIDGVDITQIGLEPLRSRLTIIPQDPVLYSGTLRTNLDPFDEQSDADVYEVMKLSHLQSFFTDSCGLNHEVLEGGSNLSVGQRQLVCLARAMLRKSKILVLDEATAATDPKTDELVQATIRKEFADCTVITIAHRINTIMDNDRIMVLDQGKVAEFDTPENLLRGLSLFQVFARDAGIV